MPWACLESRGVSPLRFPMNPGTLYSCILFCAVVCVCRLLSVMAPQPDKYMDKAVALVRYAFNK